MLQFESLFQKKVLHPVLCRVTFRWVEDKQVAIRLLKLCPNIVKMVNHWESLPKWKRPSSKSYENLLTAVNDNLIPAKLQFSALLLVSSSHFYQSIKVTRQCFHFSMMIF